NANFILKSTEPKAPWDGTRKTRILCGLAGAIKQTRYLSRIPRYLLRPRAYTLRIPEATRRVIRTRSCNCSTIFTIILRPEISRRQGNFQLSQPDMMNCCFAKRSRRAHRIAHGRNWMGTSVQFHDGRASSSRPIVVGYFGPEK